MLYTQRILYIYIYRTVPGRARVPTPHAQQPLARPGAMCATWYIDTRHIPIYLNTGIERE